MTEKTSNLPTLAELIKDTGMTVQQNKLNILLNQEPPQAWVKEHPNAKDANNKPIRYIPIERVEWLLFRIFIKWRKEVRQVQLIGNSVVVTVRLHYLNPTSGEWEWQDGVGAMPLQTAKGSGAIDFNALKSAAVQMAAPAAESFALKDAAEALGRLFGKDINRRDQLAYEGMNVDTFEKAQIIQLQKELSDKISQCQDTDLVNEVLDKTLEAEEKGINTLAFYQEMIAKFNGGRA